MTNHEKEIQLPIINRGIIGDQTPGLIAMTHGTQESMASERQGQEPMELINPWDEIQEEISSEDLAQLNKQLGLNINLSQEAGEAKTAAEAGENSEADANTNGAATNQRSDAQATSRAGRSRSVAQAQQAAAPAAARIQIDPERLNALKNQANEKATQQEKIKLSYTMIQLVQSNRNGEHVAIPSGRQLMGMGRDVRGLTQIARSCAIRLMPSQIVGAQMDQLNKATLQEAARVCDRVSSSKPAQPEEISCQDAWTIFSGISGHIYTVYRQQLIELLA